MVIDARGLSLVETAPHIRAELSVDFEAVDISGERQVLLEVGLTERLTSAVGQRGDAVGRKAKKWRDVLGALLLHLGVPKHCLPALGERLEGIGDKPVLKTLHCRLVRGRFEPESGLKLGHVIARFGADALVDDVHAGAAHDGEEVRPEREVRTVALLQRTQHP